MLLNLQTGKTKVELRIDYLLHGTEGERDPSKVHILDGDPELFTELAGKNPYQVKTYNFLISFAESREELEKKLAEKGKTIEDLYHEVFSLLLPAEYYPRDSLNVLAIAHSDTDNFHIHLTVENYDYQKSLYIPKNRTETDFYRALERYFKVRYGLSFGKPKARNEGRIGKEIVKEILLRRGTYREKSRDEVKEELTNFFVDLIRSGEIETRDDIVAYLQTIDGVKINRKGKGYISFRVEGEKKPFRLKGGIYDERQFAKLKEYFRTGEREIPTLEGARELLEAAMRKRESYIAKRRKPNLERLESPDLDHGRELSVVNARQPERLENYHPDRAFPLDWPAAIRSAVAPPPEGFSPSLRAEDTDGPERPEVENLRPSGRGDVSGRRRKLGRLPDGGHSYAAVKLRRMVKMRKDLNEIRELELELLKNLDPVEVLSALTGSRWEEKNGYLLLRSPLREEKNPSFEVFYGTERGCWIYVDFGTGWKGTSIDLWAAAKGEDYVTAVQEMRSAFGLSLLEREEDLGRLKQAVRERIQAEQRKQAERRERLARRGEVHRILEVKEPKHPALLRYLKERGIEEVPEWLKEIHYLYFPSGKRYFALAVRDESGVWHARNPYGKVNILTAPDQNPTYTLLKGNGKTVVVVEGFFDALTLWQRRKGYDVVILNSTANVKKLIRSGILRGYKQVVLALDNDEAGRRAEQELFQHLKGMKVVRMTYSTGKDLNECYLKGGKLELEEVEATPGRYWIGKAGGRTIIADEKEILERLGAQEIEEIRTSEIAEYWRAHECRGEVDLYFRDLRAPEWVHEGLGKAVWVERVRYDFMPDEEVEQRPTQVFQRRYFRVSGRVVLDREVEEEPERYLEMGGELQRYAEEMIKRRRMQELEVEEARRRKKRRGRRLRL